MQRVCCQPGWLRGLEIATSLMRQAPGGLHASVCKESSERADMLSGGAAGEWAAGMRSGFGTYWYPGGDIYQGDWRAGRRHGDGSQHCAALEAQYIGEWCA